MDGWQTCLEITRVQEILAFCQSTYMTSYLTTIDTNSLSRTVFEIFDFLGLTLVLDP